jgi:valyl-tRNA synthetase
MDEGLSRAVRKVFVELYQAGLIYRGDYIINWCPRCHTALADLEVEHEEKESALYYVRYFFENQKDYLVVATTRPETIPGDTAVAVNPEDSRYRTLSGSKVILPVLKKSIPVIMDAYVDKEFGTGALKITPAHDLNDFEIGNRHHLERIKVIDEDGRMNEWAGPYQGLDRFECRKQILEDLRQNNLLEKVEPYKNAVGHCSRCETMIEPLLSKQWFVKTGPLAKRAILAVEQGQTRIVPANWQATYYEWMNNIRDWCISRQIWWGHRIPAWYCDDCQEVIVAETTPQECPKCNQTHLRQEDDVLDTWFSSALWPFSTLGWPDQTIELKTFYPTSVLVTGFDILFFWVARMMMMGLHFMGAVPFKDVYIHALIKDEEGKKMSKSKGNAVDPLELMDKYGTDALRFTLTSLAAQGRDIKISEDRIAGYRHFVNKLWNSARLVLTNLTAEMPETDENEPLQLPERWIFTRLGQVSREMAGALDEYRFNDAAQLCYQFVWHEFCDWYLEMAKSGLYGKDETLKKNTEAVLYQILKAVIRLAHPFMPFITEDIWQRLPAAQGSIMQAPFPQATDFRQDEKALRDMDILMGAITAVRNIRGEMDIPPSKKVDIVIEAPDEHEREILDQNAIHLKNLALVHSAVIAEQVTKPEASATAVFNKNQIHVILKGLIDFKEEANRLRKEIKKIEQELGGHEKKLSNPEFVNKAPAEIIAHVKEKHDIQKEKLARLHHHLAFIESIRG